MAEEVQNQQVKCPECKPGAPMWMSTFSDLVTLLLTFFVLLLSFAKTETSKYKAALGSIREAFGGNVQNYGEVIVPGKSPEDAPTMFDSQDPIKPFPIEFLSSEGILDKHEINRASDESLNEMKNLLGDYGMTQEVEIYELPEGIKVNIKDKIYFEKGRSSITNMNVEVFEKLIKMLRDSKWKVYIQGHASMGETSEDTQQDAYMLSARRALAVARTLMSRGVKSEQIVTISYGDSRPIKLAGKKLSREEQDRDNRRVEFILRKVEIDQQGHRVR